MMNPRESRRQAKSTSPLRRFRAPAARPISRVISRRELQGFAGNAIGRIWPGSSPPGKMAAFSDQPEAGFFGVRARDSMGKTNERYEISRKSFHSTCQDNEGDGLVEEMTVKHGEPIDLAVRSGRRCGGTEAARHSRFHEFAEYAAVNGSHCGRNTGRYDLRVQVGGRRSSTGNSGGEAPTWEKASTWGDPRFAFGRPCSDHRKVVGPARSNGMIAFFAGYHMADYSLTGWAWGKRWSTARILRVTGSAGCRGQVHLARLRRTSCAQVVVDRCAGKRRFERQLGVYASTTTAGKGLEQLERRSMRLARVESPPGAKVEVERR